MDGRGGSGRRLRGGGDKIRCCRAGGGIRRREVGKRCERDEPLMTGWTWLRHRASASVTFCLKSLTFLTVVCLSLSPSLFVMNL